METADVKTALKTLPHFFWSFGLECEIIFNSHVDLSHIL